jgi:Protein of unknown function (DUF2917)
LDGACGQNEDGFVVAHLSRKPIMFNTHQSRVSSTHAMDLGRAPFNDTIATATTVHVRRPGWLGATGGALWVTRPSLIDDIVIAANDWYFLDAGRGVVVEPLQRKVVTGVAWRPLPVQRGGDRQDLVEAACHGPWGHDLIAH